MIEVHKIVEQLSCPTGSLGLEVGEKMNSANGGMIKNTLAVLDMEDKDTVLELGYGNGYHIQAFFEQHPNVQYVGLDISELMYKEANQRNSSFVRAGKARFDLYDGGMIPMADNSFETVFTVNTIYFWNKPRAFVAEICRVLKANGKLVLAFVHQQSMKQLPFEACGFEVYDLAKLKSILQGFPMVIQSAESTTEQVTSNTGEKVNREYLIVNVVYNPKNKKQPNHA
ncbi:MAG: class I SAM-dependent methyltransferase [Bacteroidota bacterium]